MSETGSMVGQVACPYCNERSNKQAPDPVWDFFHSILAPQIKRPSTERGYTPSVKKLTHYLLCVYNPHGGEYTHKHDDAKDKIQLVKWCNSKH